MKIRININPVAVAAMVQWAVFHSHLSPGSGSSYVVQASHQLSTGPTDINIINTPTLPGLVRLEITRRNDVKRCECEI